MSTFKLVVGSVFVCSLLGCGGDSSDDTPDFTLSESFVRADPAAESPSGHTVVEECSATGETYDAAVAMVQLEQFTDRSVVTLSLAGGRADTVFTAWLRLRGRDPVTMENYGGNPITDAGSTALAPSTELAGLVEMMDGPGSPSAANSFTTDASGNGSLTLSLDFPLVGGAYPFENYDAELEPVNIVGAPDAPFMIRLASHCTDDLAHGLSQGDREAWFNWSPL